MTKSRDAMLARIRDAINQGNPATVVDSTQVTPATGVAVDALTLVAQFAHRVEEYKAWVGQCTRADLATVIAGRLQLRQCRTIVVPADVLQAWLPAGVQYVQDHQLSRTEIAASDGVITGAALGIAQTGTIVLDGGVAQGRRMLTLLPDYHLCVIYASQIVHTVPEAFATLQRAFRTPHQPYTLVSGPSATSDIELNRVEGVHGPRTLDVCIIVDA